MSGFMNMERASEVSFPAIVPSETSLKAVLLFASFGYSIDLFRGCIEGYIEG